MQPGILIVDDEQLIRWSLSARLSGEGYRIVEAETAAQAIDRARDGIDLILLDYRLPDADGLEVLKRVKQASPEVLVIMLTAHSSIEMAVEAMKHGAYHFASKPFDLDEVALLVEKALETTRLRREVRTLRAREAAPYSLDRIVGESQAIVAMRALLHKIAGSPASTVLLSGESGTGKDLAAKVIHYASDRATRPFMNITCSALPKRSSKASSSGTSGVRSPAPIGRSAACSSPRMAARSSSTRLARWCRRFRRNYCGFSRRRPSGASADRRISGSTSG
jgi:two-component system, NtrC family, response regulator AtoC